MRKPVEIVIVIVILVVLGLMIAPACLKIREAAAKAQCFNNCRLMGMSLRDYQDHLDGFPPAAMPNSDLSAEKRLSWIVILIPYVEANNIYARMDKAKSWDAEENRFATEMRIAFLRCPSYPERPTGSPLSPTHYVGISGIGDNAIAVSREDPRAGIFGYDRAVKKDELKRGASEMAVVVETSQASGAWTAAGFPTTRGLVPGGSASFGRRSQFGGHHPHGANVVFADGSVRFIEQSIDPAAWEAMATLSGKGNQE